MIKGPLASYGSVVKNTVLWGPIHSTKIPTGPTGKSGPPQKVDPFFRNFSGWTEPIHWVLDRNFRKFWLNGSRPWFTPKVRLTNQMTTRTRKLHGKRGKTKSPDQLKWCMKLHVSVFLFFCLLWLLRACCKLSYSSRDHNSRIMISCTPSFSPWKNYNDDDERIMQVPITYKHQTQTAVINIVSLRIFINLTFRILFNIHFQKWS